MDRLGNSAEEILKVSGNDPKIFPKPLVKAAERQPEKERATGGAGETVNALEEEAKQQAEKRESGLEQMDRSLSGEEAPAGLGLFRIDGSRREKRWRNAPICLCLDFHGPVQAAPWRCMIAHCWAMLSRLFHAQ